MVPYWDLFKNKSDADYNNILSGFLSDSKICGLILEKDDFTKISLWINGYFKPYKS